MDSNFQYAEAVKLVVALLRRLLGRVGVLRFSSFFYERQAIRRSLAPTNIGSSSNSAHELEHSASRRCRRRMRRAAAAYGP
jgi:hypothetical protein